jgi:MFS family permease
LTRKELGFASLSGVIWATYNTAYIIVVSFAPLLLAARGFPVGDAALVASAATWPLVLSIPLGGILADRTGRGDTIMHCCFIAMAACIPLLLIVPYPLAMLAFIGLAVGPAAGIIMALPARALRPVSRSFGMGVYYTWYYLAMAALPGLAGWSSEFSGIASAPLVFASLLVVVAMMCALLFRRLEKRAVQRA